MHLIEKYKPKQINIIIIGKSTVSSYIYEKGVIIIDADKIAREIVEPDTEGYINIINNFYIYL